MYSATRLGVLLLVLCLTACSSKSPDAVAERYWHSVFTGDLETLETVVTEDSISAVTTVRVPEAGSSYRLQELRQVDDNRAEIATSVTLVQDGNTTVNQIDTVLLKEDGAWKVDLRRTRRALYASLLQQAFSSMGDSLQQGAAAVEELGAQMAQEMNEELLRTTKELQEKARQANEALRQSLEDIENNLQNNGN